MQPELLAWFLGSTAGRMTAGLWPITVAGVCALQQGVSLYFHTHSALRVSSTKSTWQTILLAAFNDCLRLGVWGA